MKHALLTEAMAHIIVVYMFCDMYIHFLLFTSFNVYMHINMAMTYWLHANTMCVDSELFYKKLLHGNNLTIKSIILTIVAVL